MGRPGRTGGSAGCPSQSSPRCGPPDGSARTSCYSTSPPQSSHLAALVVHGLTGIPWVADFRDEWAADAHGSTAAGSSAARRSGSSARSRAEPPGSSLPPTTFDLAGALRRRRRSRVEIVNGVDEDGLAGPATLSPEPGGSCLLTSGRCTASATRVLSSRALAALVDRGAIDRERVVVRLVGSMWLEGFQPPAGIEVEVTGYVDHVRRDRGDVPSDGAAALRPGHEPRAVGEALRVPRLGAPDSLRRERPDNLASRLVREWGAGVVADPDDREAIEQAILRALAAMGADGLPRQDEVRERTLATLLAARERPLSSAGVLEAGERWLKSPRPHCRLAELAARHLVGRGRGGDGPRGTPRRASGAAVAAGARECERPRAALPTGRRSSAACA